MPACRQGREDGKWTEAEVFTLLSSNSLQRLMISANFNNSNLDENSTF